VNGGPNDDVVDRAQHRPRHVTRTNARMASVFAGLTIFGVGFLVAAGVQAIALGLIATGMFLGGIYVVAWWRARRAASHVISGPYTPVQAQDPGWLTRRALSSPRARKASRPTRPTTP
jgi:hypothetical protein